MKSWLACCQSLLILSCLAFPAVSAQDSSEYDEWKKQFLTEYDSYRDEIDREFADFLKLKWKKFDTREGIRRDPVPKPVSLPKQKPQAVQTPEPVAAPAPPPVKPVTEKPPELPEPLLAKGDKLELSFLGHRITLFVNIDRGFALAGPVTQKSLQSGFDKLAQSDYENLTSDLLGIRKKLRLNDWAYLQLVRQFSQKFVPNSINSANLLSWFLLLKSGLKSRIAFANNELYLLMSTEQRLYDLHYFKFSNERFYVFSSHQKISNSLFSYNGTYPRKLPRSDLSGIERVVTGQALEYRDIRFTYGGTRYDLRVPFNRHVIDFLATYPQMQVERYFNVAISKETQESLLSQLKPLVAQLPEREAVNFLLRLVQTGFDYKTDKQQFGRENYLFLEETIFYPSSDCEDRSIIFAWLIENLLGLEVIGLDFPGHVATAVKLGKPSGALVKSGNKLFTVADPTYINAPVGIKMPQFENVNPKVINFIR